MVSKVLIITSKNMIPTQFLELLKKSTYLSLDFAKNYVLNELPKDFKYTVILNISSDDPSLKQFDVYPSDNHKKLELIGEKEVVELLCRKEKVPVWINISVETVYRNQTIFCLHCAGRYSADEDEFYYNKDQTGPFGIKSPYLPIGYKEGEKFKLKSKYKKPLLSWLKGK
jgi:hypothetical protein